MRRQRYRAVAFARYWRFWTAKKRRESIIFERWITDKRARRWWRRDAVDALNNGLVE